MLDGLRKVTQLRALSSFFFIDSDQKNKGVIQNYSKGVKSDGLGDEL